MRGDSIDEMEPDASSPRGAHRQRITECPELGDGEIEVINEEGQVVEARLPRRVHVAYCARARPVVLHEFDHQRTPLTVCRRVIERTGIATMYDIGDWNVRANEERTGTQVGRPSVCRLGSIVDGVGDLYGRTEQCAQHVHTPIPSDFARDPLSW